MTLHEVLFRVTRDDPAINISRKLPSLKMIFWCNRKHDVVELVVQDPAEYKLLAEQLPKPEGVVAESSDQQGVHLITKKCSCVNEESVIKHIEDLAILHVSPSFLEKGWQYHRVIVFRHQDLEELLNRLRKAEYEVEVLRKVALHDSTSGPLTFNAEALLSDLTNKQLDALLTAHRNGYFKTPRKTDVKTIAAKKRVPRTTFQEHLNKAENKLVSDLVPYIQLLACARTEKRREEKRPSGT
jgi:predicted DNA binding protein